MEFSMKADVHTHSVYSFDGNHSCSDLCEYAIKNGVKYLAITDHCEIDSKTIEFYPDKQFEDVYNMKEKFKGRLNVYNGLEIGQAIYNKPLAEKILGTYDYDFVLGSIHNLENMEDFYFLDYTVYDPFKLLRQYFDMLIELCEWGNFDSLAHLTYPVRYIKGNYNIDVDLNDYKAQIDEILELLIKDDKALELNTSGLGMKIHNFLPGIEIIKRFADMGGKYVTIGSDSHFREKIGNYIDDGLTALKSVGINYIAVYEKREPKLIEIK